MPLALISPEFDALVKQSTEDARHEMVQRACLLAVTQTKIDDATVAEALEAICQRQFGNLLLKVKLDALTEELDEIAWDIQDRVKAGETAVDEYDRAFAKARAVAGVGYALDGSLKSSLEALYETYHAVDAGDEFIRSVVG